MLQKTSSRRGRQEYGRERKKSDKSSVGLCCVQGQIWCRCDMIVHIVESTRERLSGLTWLTLSLACLSTGIAVCKDRHPLLSTPRVCPGYSRARYPFSLIMQKPTRCVQLQSYRGAPYSTDSAPVALESTTCHEQFKYILLGKKSAKRSRRFVRASVRAFLHNR